MKIKLRPFKSSDHEHINEKGDEPLRGFGYLSLFFGKMEQGRDTVMLCEECKIICRKKIPPKITYTLGIT